MQHDICYANTILTQYVFDVLTLMVFFQRKYILNKHISIPCSVYSKTASQGMRVVGKSQPGPTILIAISTYKP